LAARFLFLLLWRIVDELLDGRWLWHRSGSLALLFLCLSLEPSLLFLSDL
jgi:hypothetical protein